MSEFAGLGKEMASLVMQASAVGNQSSTSVSATVEKVEDGVAYVRFDGADVLTPVETGMTASVGDSVSVRIDDGRAVVTDNLTRPATDDRLAGEAAILAQSASDAASAAETVANEAMEIAEATGQHFWDDENGAHVTDVAREEWEEAVDDGFSDLSDSKPYHNALWNSLGMLFRRALYNLVSISRSAIAFFDGTGNQAANITARFGTNGFQVGMTDESHLVGDYHSLQLVDKEGAAYFHVSDLRNADGEAIITETFNGNSSTVSFDVACNVSSEVSVKIGTNDVSYTRSGKRYTLSRVPSSSQVVKITYGTTDQEAKAYTLGLRYSASSIGVMSVAEGMSTSASGAYSHAEGNRTTARGSYSHSEGYFTSATATGAHAEGYGATASGTYSHAEGSSDATAWCAHAEGGDTTASGYYAHAEGELTVASDYYAHAEGYRSTASGGYGSHAEGNATTASGDASHSEGSATVASSAYSHAEGHSTTASGSGGSHAEGTQTKASGADSHAEGFYTTASGEYSHAEGYLTTSSNADSHAEGYRSSASNTCAHAQNLWTIAKGFAQTALGKYNVEDPGETVTDSFVGDGITTSYTLSKMPTTRYVNVEIDGVQVQSYGQVIGDFSREVYFQTAPADGAQITIEYQSAQTYAVIVGNGVDENNRSNALTVDWQGNVACGTVNGADLPSGVPLLKGATLLASGTDLNGIVDTGTYYANSNNAANISNCPVAGAFKLYVERTLSTATYIKQRFELYDAVNQWVRFSKNGGSSWSYWYREAAHSKNNEAANQFLATPNGSAGLPDYRSIVNADLPTVDAAHGGTGQTTLSDAQEALANSLSTESVTLTDSEQLIIREVGSTTKWHRRSLSALWSYIKGKASYIFPLLVGGTQLASTDNLDNIKDVGTYYITGSSNTPQNAPTGFSVGKVIVDIPHGLSSSSIRGQHYISYSTGREAYRKFESSSWSDWTYEPVRGPRSPQTYDVKSLITQTSTQSGNFTISAASLVVSGYVAQLTIDFTIGAALTANTEYSLGTLPTSIRPAGRANAGIGDSRFFAAIASGTMYLRPQAATSAGTSTYRFNSTYIMSNAYTG